MKKTLLLLALAAAMAACTPTTTTPPAGADSTKVDSVPVVVQDSQPAVDSTAPVVGDAGTSTDPAPTTDPNGKSTSEASTGRQANPNGNLGAKHFNVSGRFLVKRPYCGGAAPTPDMIKAAETGKPLAGQGFIIRKGTANALGTAIETRVTTDNDGVFKVSLAPGTYCMVLNEKENRRTPEFLKTPNYEIDKKCDDKWMGACDLSFTVADKDISGLRVTLEGKCMVNSLSPCINWGGPLPSVPAPRTH